MNMTIDQYLGGFERTARELPALLSDWETLDNELRGEYAEQLLWMLSKREDVQVRASRERRFFDVGQRINAATKALFDHRQELSEFMGIPLDRIVPYTAYTDPTENDTSLRLAI